MMKRKRVDEVTFLEQEAQDFIAVIGQRLTEPDDVRATLTHVIAQVVQFFAAEEASIFLVDQESGDIVLTYAKGIVGERIIGLRLTSGQGVVGWVIRFGEDLIVPYPGMDERFFGGVDESTGFSTRSILCSPIQVDGNTIGAIEVLNKSEGTFNDDDLVLLRAITRLVAKVIPNTG